MTQHTELVGSPRPRTTARGKSPRTERHSLPELPSTVELELATLVDAPPEGDEWLHEIKLDGYRMLCRCEGPRVRLITRNDKDWTARAPSVIEAVRALKLRGTVLDGEVVSLRPDGVSNFQSLQNALREGRSHALVYFVFDLLFEEGRDLRKEPLEQRKAHLREIIARAPSPHLRMTEHVVSKGGAFYRGACKLGLEGIISKRRSAPYRGGRTHDWLKTKCIARQEMVIVGYTDPSGSRAHFGALLLALHRDGALRYAGKVGTGFTEASLAELHARLKPLERKTPAFVGAPRGAEARRAHWVEPTCVAQVAFTELTEDGRLRHPTFEGLREDKPASEVVPERASPLRSPPKQRRARSGAGARKVPIKKGARHGDAKGKRKNHR